MTEPNAALALGRTVFIASDHAGVAVKADLGDVLRALGCEVRDLGPQSTESVDYPDFAKQLGHRVVADDGWGVLVCGSGIGMSIAANKVDGVRAALVHDGYTARMARQHNDANVVVVGARVLGPDILRECVQVFARTEFTPGSDGRHRRRVNKIEGTG